MDGWEVEIDGSVDVSCHVNQFESSSVGAWCLGSFYRNLNFKDVSFH